MKEYEVTKKHPELPEGIRFEAKRIYGFVIDMWIEKGWIKEIIKEKKMGEKLLYFTMDWLVSLPMTLCYRRKCLVIRIIGILFMIPWVSITIVPFSILLFLFALWMTIDEA